MDPEAERQGLTSKLGLGFPVLQDASMAITDAYGVREKGKDHPGPATFVLDADHRVVFIHAGRNAADRPALRDILGALGD